MKQIILILFTISFLFCQQVGNGSGNHSIGLSVSGIVYTWGYNVSGQLGDKTQTNSSTPMQVLKGLIQVQHTLVTILVIK